MSLVANGPSLSSSLRTTSQSWRWCLRHQLFTSAGFCVSSTPARFDWRKSRSSWVCTRTVSLVRSLPFGPLHNQRVFVDAALATDPAIVFNAGSHHDAIRMPYREFERLARPVVAHFATEAAPSTLPRSAILTDPVCGMALEDRHTDARSEHRGASYYFCSQSCKMEFDDNPFVYA